MFVLKILCCLDVMLVSSCALIFGSRLLIDCFLCDCFRSVVSLRIFR